MNSIRNDFDLTIAPPLTHGASDHHRRASQRASRSHKSKTSWLKSGRSRSGTLFYQEALKSWQHSSNYPYKILSIAAGPPFPDGIYRVRRKHRDSGSISLRTLLVSELWSEPLGLDLVAQRYLCGANRSSKMSLDHTEITSHPHI